MRINLTKLKLKPTLKNVAKNPKNAILIALAILLVASQVYTFIDRGQILSFKVRTVNKKVDTKALTTKRSQQDISKSLVCSTISPDFMKKLLGTEVKQSTLYSDVMNNKLTSNSTCIYTADKKTVTISFQEKSDKDLAVKEVQKTKSKSSSKEVKDYLDESYFVESAGQLTSRKGNKVVNVFIKVESGSKLNIQDVAKEITNKLLN